MRNCTIILFFVLLLTAKGYAQVAPPQSTVQDLRLYSRQTTGGFVCMHPLKRVSANKLAALQEGYDKLLALHNSRGSTFVAGLSAIGTGSLPALFVENKDALPTYTEQNLLVVLDSLEARIRLYDGTNNSRIAQLIYWMRGYAFHDHGVSLGFSEHIERIREVLVPLSKKEELFAINKENVVIADAFATLIDYADLRVLAISDASSLFYAVYKECTYTYAA